MCLYFPKPFVPSFSGIGSIEIRTTPLFVSSRGKLPLFAVKRPFVGLFSALIYNHEVKADIQYYY